MRKCSGVSGSPQVHMLLSHWPSLCLKSLSSEYSVCICKIRQKLFLLGISKNFLESTFGTCIWYALPYSVFLSLLSMSRTSMNMVFIHCTVNKLVSKMPPVCSINYLFENNSHIFTSMTLQYIMKCSKVKVIDGIQRSHVQNFGSAPFFKNIYWKFVYDFTNFLTLFHINHNFRHLFSCYTPGTKFIGGI